MLSQSTLCLAAQEIASIQTYYAKKGFTLSEAALCGSREFVEWQHYPNNDLVDIDSGYEFYYHSHSVDEMPEGEHGHFHIFKRTGTEFHHLIGIALNQTGLPVRLFTTNQWVTGETLVKAEIVLAQLQAFDISIKGRMSPIARWISALRKLFYIDMEALILERDSMIDRMKSDLGSLEAALSKKQYHVLTERKIDLMERLSQHLLLVN